MRIFVDPCVLSRIGLGSQVYKVSEPGKPGFRLTDTELYTTSVAHSCVLLLVSRYAIVHLNGKLGVAGCLVARTHFRLFICKAYSWLVTARSKDIVPGCS